MHTLLNGATRTSKMMKHVHNVDQSIRKHTWHDEWWHSSFVNVFWFR